MASIFAPLEHVQNELLADLQRIFPAHFAETNIFPVGKTEINYENKNGVVRALVTLHWQRKSDYKTGAHSAIFTYQERRGKNGREMYWYCNSGLPGD